MRVALASACAGLAAWCSLGTIGFLGSGGTLTRVGLPAPLWWMPLLIAAFFLAARVARLSPADASPLFGSALLVLPWVPLPLPAAAFLLTGPLSGVVWVLVAGAVVHSRGSRLQTAWLTSDRRAPLVASCAALVLFGASARGLAPVLPDGDSPHYLILAQSLVRDGDIQIENNHARGDYLEYSLHAAQPDYLRRGVNRQIYSIHAPGLPAVIAPAMWLLGYPGVVAFLGLIAAATTGLVWWLAKLITDDAAAAWFAWALCALTAPFFFLATEVFPDGFAATCLLVGLLPVFLSDRRGCAHPWRDGVVVWWAAGAALAILPWLQTRLASLAAVAAILLVLRMPGRRALVACATLPALSAAAWFAFFWMVYGTPNPAAPYGPLTQSSLSNMARGLPGVLVDQQFGLLPNAPIYGVVLCGLAWAALRRRRYGLEVLALAVPYAVSVAMYQHWWGGASAPARLLTPLVPVVTIAAARWWSDARHATRAFAASTLALSAYLAALMWFPDDGRLLINFRDGISLWAEWAQDDVALARALPSLFSGTTAAALMKAAAWGAAGALAWLGLEFLLSNEDPRRRRAAPWLAIGLLALVPVLAATLAWRVDGTSPVTTARSEVGLLRALTPAGPRAWNFTTFRTMPAADLRSHLSVRSDEQRPRARPSHVLSAQRVPAGRYRLLVDPPGSQRGALTLRLGDTGLPFATVATSPSALGMQGPEVALPVAVRTVVVDADPTAVRGVSTARLEPVEPWDGPEAHLTARRAARYVGGDLFFLDDHAYPEPSGFWVAGSRTTTAIVAADAPELRLFIRNAPVQNVVRLELDAWSQELRLGPGEERELRVPRRAGSRVSTLRVQANGGFRPSQQEPGNKDLRYLGCWVEPR